jgi:tRNA(fMet)-specific endonuclease VapC
LPLAALSASAITEAELYYGALHSAYPKRNEERVRRFLAPLHRLGFDSDAAVQFAELKQYLVKKGKMIKVESWI